MTITHKDLLSHDAIHFAMFLSAYKECSPEIQNIVGEMTDIIVDKSCTNEEREHATDVILESLFPALTTQMREEDADRISSDGAKSARSQLEEEETVFATRLRALMDDRGITQEQLAEKTGVGQSAISNMLIRACRPQRRTIEKFATALDVSPRDLWPG